MLVQNSQTIHRVNVPDVIRCLAIGKLHGSSFIALGTHDSKLLLLDNSWQIRQELTFPQWVRSIAIGDFTGDGNDEIILGCGDRTLRYLQWHIDRYEEAAQYTFENFVDSVAIVDVNNDGIREIIAGSWDKTVSVFQLINGCFSVVWQRKIENSAGIHAVYPANLNCDEKIGILALLKGGGCVFLNGETGETLWSFSTDQDLLACAVGNFDASGYPTVVMAGEQGIVYFLNHLGENIGNLPVTKRVTALAIGDIDGDLVNELILGVGDQALEVYELPNLQILNFQLKWQRHIGSVITSIIIEDVNLDGIPEILYGGYDNRLWIVQDFFFGKKIPKPIKIPPYAPAVLQPRDSLVAPTHIRSSTLFCSGNEATRTPGVAESQTESLLSSPANTSLSTESPPINKSTGRISIAAESNRPISTRTSRKPKISKESISIVVKSLDEVASVFKAHPYFSTKEEMVSALRNADVPEIDILPSIEFYKSKKQLNYSKSVPRGYHFIAVETVVSEGVSTETPTKPLISPPITYERYDVTLLFRDVALYSSKESILHAIQDIYSLPDAETANSLFEYFKTASFIQYSRSTPRGYSQTTSVTPVPPVIATGVPSKTPEVTLLPSQSVISPSTPPVSSSSFLSPETEVKIREIFLQTPLFSLKANLLHALEQIYPIPEQISTESLLNLCKIKHIIQYSSKSPRGYSLV